MTNQRRIIVIANQKGGVAKTTTAINLAVGLAYSGRKTLLIDLDPQANSTFATIGSEEPEDSGSIYGFLLEENPDVSKAVHSTKIPNLSVIPSKRDLAIAEELLIPPKDGFTRLRKRIQKHIGNSYHFIVIDVPPSLGRLTVNAMSAASEVIVPINPSMFGLQGLARLKETISEVQEDLNNPQLHISGILCTFYDYTLVSQDVIKIIHENFGDLIFDTIIPKNIKIEEANSRSKSIYDYAPDSKGALAYAQFVEEVITRG